MNGHNHAEVVGNIEGACCSAGTRLTPRSRRAIRWFLHLIDSADSPEVVNAYAEAIAEQDVQLIEPVRRSAMADPHNTQI